MGAQPARDPFAPEGGRERERGDHRAGLERQDGLEADQGQRDVERSEDGEADQRVAEPAPGGHHSSVDRVDRGDERAGRDERGEHHVPRVERGRRVVGGQHEEEQVVIERLDRVVGGGEHEPAPPLGERPAELGDHDEEQPQEQQVAHDPAHVRQAAAEDEQGGQAQGQREDRDGPAAEPADQRQARRGRGTPVGHVAGGLDRRRNLLLPPVEEEERDREEGLRHREDAVEEHPRHEVVGAGHGPEGLTARDRDTEDQHEERGGGPENAPALARGELGRLPPDGEHGSPAEHHRRIHEREAHQEREDQHGQSDEPQAPHDPDRGPGLVDGQPAERGQQQHPDHDEAHEHEAGPRAEALREGLPVGDRHPVLDTGERGQQRAHHEGIEHHLRGEDYA